MREQDAAAAAARGEPAGIAAVYALHAQALHRVLYRLTGSAADAEDLLHDLFVGLPELLARYGERGSLGPWLRQVAVRMALMRMRGERRRREVPMDSAPEPSAIDAASAPEERWELERAIAALPPTLRAVIVLRHLEGCTHDEIAAALGISPAASRVRHVRALRMLRQTLGER